MANIVELCLTAGSQVSGFRYCSSHFPLCFGGFFRLSTTTFVTAGAIPEFRARRRASVAASNFFFFLFRDFPISNPISILAILRLVCPA
jgi:hypothetical protein